ncbi:MAG: FeoA family protein [Paracholeplasma sp.]|jgi:ferrous iron transport protein A|uniref:Putative Fe2+ transport system protein A n=1 Tax=Acholeplasma brassicae TaxID=61635 RepID=U4KS10_9MOLU|nr:MULTISPECIES: FeoA family protein [Paracholeplasma]MDY3196236.1 FeoA family protein [Paracholeplasma sp.]CCV66228.1 putative Fe2+ transport system protein A [Paracholeplasma brassicae]
MNQTNKKEVTLDTLKIGQRGVVVKLLTTDKALRRRLLDMGLTRGVQVLIKKVAPLGDPYDILIRDYELCIRKLDMKNILVEVER